MHSREAAQERDRRDPLRGYRQRFHVPAGQIYLDGNSLGLLTTDAEAEVLRSLAQWKDLGISGWLGADPPWFTLGEDLGALVAPLVGAEPQSVVVTGSTTVNLHALLATFYRPQGRRRKIIATGLDFPSDIYALQSEVALQGGDPATDVVHVPSANGRTVDEEAIIAAMTEDAAFVVIPSVMYRSGQLLDIPRLAAAGRARGIPVLFDCAHSVGAVPHEFDAWNVDFAVWCSYKYLNAGPGATAGMYVNRRHWGTSPGLAGWWGYDKDRQFDMVYEWRGGAGAGAWQIGTPPLLATAPLRGSLRLFHEAGMERLREKSLALTSYLMELIEQLGLTEQRYGYAIGTPRDGARRGGHVAVEHQDAARIAKALRERGVIPDFRAPNVIRLAPVPLLVGFEDVWSTVQHLKGIIDGGEHLKFQAGRERVA